MDITKMILSSLGNEGLDKLSGQIGADQNSTKKALEGAIPSLLGAMAKNTQSSQGAEGLLGALDRDHDGSILDDIGGFLGDSSKQEDGDGILKHVLGNNRTNVESSLSSKTGMSSSSISQLLKIAAPILLGFLGKQKKSASSGFDISSLSGLLGGLAGTADKGTGLDLSDIMDLVGSFSGNSQKSSGIGGLLKGLFGR